jgi:hypothetical protein
MIATMDEANPHHLAGNVVSTPPCPHHPPCPGSDAPDRYRAHTLVSHPEQGWSLLCNRIISFDDLHALLPNCTAV